ncbi:hypothetical protein DU68_01490 [Methanosarcina mazei]|uniref:Glycosyltransferase RgtA/B/C/D-like domain-containing protein n=4 Tax=Methanosarcina mazei TaxID=2209 RepID=A0A0F8JG44_METMZ|nr:hypothetical protein DU56_04725 [Methanosarcina mazei]KKH00367.1 hypothetical protein DU66_09400 [Methanosarcina mazei]KKH02836.1 hypothetical protein DU68_01490 [Methanosarcina mazei]
MDIKDNYFFDRFFKFFWVFSSLFFTLYLYLFKGDISYTIVGILTLISSIIWFFCSNNASVTITTNSPLKINLIIINSYLLLLTCGIYSLYNRPTLYTLPFNYYVIICLIFGIVALEIMYTSPKKSPLVLSQIIILGLFISWSQLFMSSGLIGIDPWFHHKFTYSLINQHFIPVNYAYSKFPLFHLLVASTWLISETGYKISTMFSISFIQIVCNSIFIYLLGKYLFNFKIGLLSSLLLICANYHIFMSFVSIPNSFAPTFTLAILYIMLKIKNKMKLESTVISIILMLSLILTHTLSAMWSAVTFLIFSIFYSINRNKSSFPISITFSVLFIVLMFGWWAYVSGTLLSLANMISFGFKLDSMFNTPRGFELSNIFVSPSYKIFSNIGLFAFFSLSFIGIFYMVSPKYANLLSFTMAIVGVTPLFLGFFSLVTQRSIITERWWYFAQIMLSIPLSVGIIIIFNSIKNMHLQKIMLLLVIISLSFSMLLSPLVNMGDNLLFPHVSRQTFTEAELQAVYTISSKYNGPVDTDEQMLYLSFLNIGISFNSINEELYLKKISIKPRYIFIRSYLMNHLLNIYNWSYLLDYDPNKELENLRFMKIYDSNAASLFYY